MRWFSNLSTKNKLTLSFGLTIVILMFVMGVSYMTINYLNKTNENLYKDKFTLLENLMKLNIYENAIRTAFLSMILSESKQEQEEWQQKIITYSNIIDATYREVSSDNKLDSKFMEEYDLLISTREENRKTRNELIPMIYAGKLEDVKKIATGAQNDRYEKINSILGMLISNVKDRVNEALLLSNKEVTKSIIFFLIMGSLSIFIVLALVFILSRLIAGPLKEISNAAQRIASGDISELKLNSFGRKDEVGVLAESFQTMVKNLRELTSEIAESIDFLSSSSNEISTATTQLASTASETAIAVSETTTTIEEVRQTSKIANQKAKSVSETTKKSSEVSQAGKQAADEIREITHQIHSQMELIADSMVRLSEQSQAIGTIISSVDDLSQQSNLLSVNASIEAAKAGEQGKGFAVVAQEVKSLANQSKQATNQVRAILSDIQKATSAAVMATEQGSKAVEEGVKKSTKTGDSILTLINTVTDSSNMATQIAASSHQQLTGMEQAAVAMENIKQASVQNVEGAKQLEASANNIKELGAKLKQLINQYKLNNNEVVRTVSAKKG